MDYQPTTLNEMLQQIQAMSTQRTNQQQSQFQYQPPQQQTLPYQMPQQQTLPYQMPRTMDIGGGVGMMPPGGWQRGENTTQAQGLQPGYGQPSQAGAGNPFAPIPNYGTSYSPNTMTNRQNQGFNLTTN